MLCITVIGSGEMRWQCIVHVPSAGCWPLTHGFFAGDVARNKKEKLREAIYIYHEIPS